MSLRWTAKESPEGEGGTSPSIFSDIYQEGDPEPIAERVYCDEADKLISAHNEIVDRD